MILDINLFCEPGSRDCAEDLVVSVASWKRRKHELMFAESWGFGFDSPGSGGGERIGDGIDPAMGDRWGLLQRHHGIKWSVGKNHSDEGLAALLQGEIEGGFPVALSLSASETRKGCSAEGDRGLPLPYILAVGFDYSARTLSYLRYNPKYPGEGNGEIEQVLLGDFKDWDGGYMTVRLTGKDKWQEADGVEVIERALARVGNLDERGSAVSMHQFADALDCGLDMEAEMAGCTNYYRVPLFYNLMRVGHGRFQFSRLLRHLSITGHFPELGKVADRLASLGRRWNLVRSLLMKLGLRGGHVRLPGRISARVRELAADEEELASVLREFGLRKRRNLFSKIRKNFLVPGPSSLGMEMYPRPALEHPYVGPRNGKERRLAHIWQDVLGVRKVGIHDDFFELGGDSLLGIHVVALVRKAGLQLTTGQLFERRTIAGLAQVEGKGSLICAEQDLVTGPVPITPGARRFLEHVGPGRNHYNVSVLLETPYGFNSGRMDQAVRHVVAHHDALRLRYFHDGRTGWQQYMAGLDGPHHFTIRDLSGIPRAAQSASIEEAAAEVQASLNLSRGPLFRVTFFDFGDHRRGRLLFVVHHIAVDGMCERFPLEDLLSVYRQFCTGDEVRIPPKTTSFKRWAIGLEKYARSEAMKKEADYWLSLPWDQVRPFPLDNAEGVNSRASSSFIEITVSPEKTHALLSVPGKSNTRVHEVLLTALALALSRWTGSDTVLVDLMHHGREPLFDHMDLSRTVGNFISHVPVVLNLGNASPASQGVEKVKEQLRKIPRGGIGYGLLRYMCGDTEENENLRSCPKAEISFNCRIHGARTLPANQGHLAAGSFQPAMESCGPPIAPDAIRGHLIGFRADIINGRANLGFTYSAALQRGPTVEALAQSCMEELDSVLGHLH